MKSAKDMSTQNSPVIKIDDSLEKYKNMPLFQEKLNKANETLKKVGTPKLKKYS